MNLDDLDTWLNIYGQFVGVDSKSRIGFALNSIGLNSNSKQNQIPHWFCYPEAQGSYHVRIIAAEMSHGNTRDLV